MNYADDQLAIHVMDGWMDAEFKYTKLDRLFEFKNFSS